jgi:2-hydroxychromene-2-carboxylate isomerase
VRRHQVKLLLKPLRLPGSGAAHRRRAAAHAPEPRRTYHALELDRWRKYLGMPLQADAEVLPADGKPGGWNKPPAGW